MVWTLNGKTSKSVDITHAQGMIAPGKPVDLATPVIGLALGQHANLQGGQFEIEIEIGQEFDRPTRKIRQLGTYDVLAVTDKLVNGGLPAAQKVQKLEFSEIDN